MPLLAQIPHGLSWDPGAHPEFLIGDGLTLNLYACVIKSRHVTVTLLCLQLRLRTYKHNYMFRDSQPNLNRTLQSS